MESLYDEVRRSIHYNPTTGDITWLIKRAYRVKVGDVLRKTKGEYQRIRFRDTNYGAHRIIWLYMTGELPINHIDHRNDERSDNHWKNLRDVTQEHNNALITVARSDSKSGVRGVHFNRGKWVAQYSVKSKTTHLGRFKTQEEAVEAYKLAKNTYLDSVLTTEQR